tara:strand:+ start:2765 stop:2956 length:192 start_codon:yes stop_codon:yes gene_type:complete
LPKKIKPILADQLRKLKRFERKNLNNQNILSDEKNNYNTIFAKSVLAYRKLISRTTPSRILIN